MKFYKKDDQLIITIDETFNDQKLSGFFKAFHFSKKAIHLLHQYKGYRVNGQYRQDIILKAGDILSLHAYEKDDQQYPPIYKAIDVVYEDDLLLIVNKPAHLPVYPSDPQNHQSLAHYVSGYYKKHHLDIPVRFIHRLDDDTSGLVIFSKSYLFQPLFDYMIQEKRIHRDYLAIVEGHFKDHDRHTIQTYLARNRHNAKRMRVAQKGQLAITHYRCIKNLKHGALVMCTLETGRRHQIRVQMAHLHHPLINDPLYNPRSKQKRQALHAYQISFIHPLTRQYVRVMCNLPPDLQSLTA